MNMLYEISSKEKHDRVVNEMLRKGFIFPNNMKPYTYEKAKIVTTEIVNCYYIHFIMI